MKQVRVSAFVIQVPLMLSLGFSPPSMSADAITCPDSAQQYWRAFRIAALQGNLTAVANASRFPFAIGRTLDQSGMRYIDRKELIRFFPTLLKSDPGLSPTPTRMKSLLNTTTRLSSSTCNPYGNQFRVGAWVFELTPEGWRFVQAFVDEQ